MSQKSSYRLGVDVGGTFTDLILIDESTGQTYAAKVPSTPHDSSEGVLNGIKKICEQNDLNAEDINSVMHGTTVATNAVLEGKGARVGLVTTEGYRQVLQIARSFVPGGLGGWVIYNKKPLLAPLEWTIEADERIDSRGNVLKPLNEEKFKKDLLKLADCKIEALTICFMNAYSSGIHEVQARKIAEQVLPGIPVSISSEVIPEMYEYERTETTVVNSYVRPVVSKYMKNLQTELDKSMKNLHLHILRSDGGLSTIQGARDNPVNLLMSGPAGGVSGAQWIAKQSGYMNLLTFDMGGTSTDVALIQDGIAQTRRETRVGDITVRAPSIDVRTVGAGGGSIAYVPELTKALRVGPQSAGASPGPAAYCKGGEKPTVTDANVTLGYLPSNSALGGDMKIDKSLAEKAVKAVAGPLGKSVHETAEGIIKIVNENMFGALRLVSIEQGYDPRDFALIAFGGAGPLHGNALGKLMGSWPVIIPPGPGVLCAYGDATTRSRDEFSQTFIRRYDETTDAEVGGILESLAANARKSLIQEGIAIENQQLIYQIDLRYRGQGMQLPIAVSADEFKNGGLSSIAKIFDDKHTQLYTFSLDVVKEIVNLRAIVLGPETKVKATRNAIGSKDPAADALIASSEVYVDGAIQKANIYRRDRLVAGNHIAGPAIITQMDTTTLILPDHTGVVDEVANILIWPNEKISARKG
jgi:N-methylhydantoinase A